MGALEITVDNGVQVIKFNRPDKKNAITREMYEGVISGLERAAADDEVVVTVLTGAGDFYSSGNDFSAAQLEDMDAHIQEATLLMRKFIGAFIDYPKLLIAVVNGPAIGVAATSLALCDVVYASDKAWFKTPFSQLGLVPEACSTLTFPRIMGTAKASKLLFLNESFSVAEALTCGFVTEVFPHSQLLPRTSALLQAFAKLPPQSLRLSKQLVRGWDRELLHRVNQAESEVLAERFTSEEFFNAIMTFNSKKSKL